MPDMRPGPLSSFSNLQPYREEETALTTTSIADATWSLANSWVRILLLSLAILLAIVLWFFPSSIDREARHALAVGLLGLILWVTHVFPHAITGLIGCYLFWTLVRVPFPTAFGGFAHTSAWFVFAAGIFGLMTTKTGLAHRLAAHLLGPPSVSYPRLVLGVILTSLLLNFLVPSEMEGLKLRAVRFPSKLTTRIVPVNLNVVTEHLSLPEAKRFDLIVATNIFVYYDVFEQSLALANVEEMLRPGGLLLSNNALLELPGSKIHSVNYLTVVYSSRADDGDHIVWYRRSLD